MKRLGGWKLLLNETLQSFGDSIRLFKMLRRAALRPDNNQPLRRAVRSTTQKQVPYLLFAGADEATDFGRRMEVGSDPAFWLADKRL